MEYEKEVLDRLINVDKLSYEAIGRMYEVSGTYIKRISKKLGVTLPVRAKFSKDFKPHNAGKRKVITCLNCGKEKPTNWRTQKYCSNACHQEYENNNRLQEWFEGKNPVRKGGNVIPIWIRRYLIEESDNKCSSCGWSGINPYSGRICLEIDHIDGDAHNNHKDNLRVLCPNCHSMTPTYKNTGGRESTRIK